MRLATHHNDVIGTTVVTAETQRGGAGDPQPVGGRVLETAFTSLCGSWECSGIAESQQATPLAGKA
jgi:hypothetical protein